MIPENNKFDWPTSTDEVELGITDHVSGRLDVPEKTGFIESIKQRYSNFLGRIEQITKKNREKYREEPILQRCQYCDRNKFFPCRDVKHMKLLDGLCPDKICALKLKEIEDANPDIDLYPDYRA